MRKGIGVLVFAGALAATPAVAQDQGNMLDDQFSVAAGASTLGVTVQPAYKVSDNLVLRLSGNYFGYSHDETIDGIDYSGDLRLLSGGLIGDWHVFGNGFRLSAGLFLNGNQLEFDATTTAADGRSFNIGGQAFNSARLDGEIDYNALAPYLGVGFDNALFYNSGWSFWAEAGVLYQGNASVSLSESTGAVSQARLNAEAADIEDELDYPFFPVIGVGLSYRF